MSMGLGNSRYIIISIHKLFISQSSLKVMKFIYKYIYR